MFLPGLDLNFNPRICDPARFSIAGVTDEPWQTRFRSDHAASAAHHFPAMRCSLPGRAQGQKLLVPRSVPVHGFHATDLLHEVNILDQLLPEAGAFYLIDRGYLDFARLYRFHQAGSFFVIRAKTNLSGFILMPSTAAQV